LVIGESLTDIVRDGKNETRHPGGSPMNVAVGLSRLGVDTQFLTRIGHDDDGAAIERHLASSGVALVASSITPDRTSSAIAAIQADGSATYQFDVEWILPSAAGCRLSRWVHIGSIATFISPGADSLERLVSVLNKGTSISYDPNIRAALIGDHAQAVTRFERLAGLSTVVKLSDEDANWLYPGLSEESLINRVLAGGTKIVALTRGADGARIVTRDHSVVVPAIQVTVADTIGAGDSFMATMIRELQLVGVEKLTAKQLARVALRSVTAAALTCTTVGAQPPNLARLDAFARKGQRQLPTPASGANF
jgi:fructokinase